MPVYEYRCSECGQTFEKLESFASPSHCSCTRCGGQADRLISLSSFILKGTGWYVTDHPSKDRKAASNHTTTSSSTTAAAPAASKDPAPAKTNQSGSDKAA